MADTVWCERDQSAAVLTAVSAVFDSFHRVLLCLDANFRIVHFSAGLAQLIGSETADYVLGHEAAEILGDELFARGGTLRNDLLQGEMREGWRASLIRANGTSRLVSCSAAPFRADAGGVC